MSRAAPILLFAAASAHQGARRMTPATVLLLAAASLAQAPCGPLTTDPLTLPSRARPAQGPADGPGCYPDCNNDHRLDVNDLVCYQTALAWSGGPNYADCNHDSFLNVIDFVCYLSAFAAGCSAL